MACHEIAALRLGLMGLLGIDDESERQHELAELGDAIKVEGPICELVNADSLSRLRALFSESLVALEEKTSTLAADDSKSAYMRSLLILTRKVELELGRADDALTGLFRDLDEMHDFVHEVYPVN